MSTEISHKATKKTLEPQLRFPEYNFGWESKAINSITEYVDYRGKTPTKTEDGIFLVTAKNIKFGYIDYESSKEFISKEDYDEVMSRGLPKIGDVLITTEAPLGNIANVDNEDIALAQRVIKYRGLSDICDNYFLKQYFLSNNFQKVLFEKATGGTVKGIKGSVLHKIKINIPSLPEQQKIASFLSAVDEKIQQLTRKKELLEQYKKGVMQQLFSGKLRFKDENGKDFPEWEEKKLGEAGKIISGLTYSPDDIHENGLLVLRSSNIKNRTLTFNDNVYVNVKHGNFNPVKMNDILICVRNGSKHLIGKNALINKEFEGVAFGAFMSVYRSKYNLFIFHYFNTDLFKKEVNKNLGATINSINGSDLKKFKIPFPCLEEQQKIADFLSSIDVKIENVNQQLNQAQQFKKGLLQQLFV